MCNRRLSRPLTKGARVVEYVVLLGVPMTAAVVVASVLLRKLKTGADILMKNVKPSSGYYH